MYRLLRQSYAVDIDPSTRRGSAGDPPGCVETAQRCIIDSNARRAVVAEELTGAAAAHADELAKLAEALRAEMARAAPPASLAAVFERVRLSGDLTAERITATGAGATAAVLKDLDARNVRLSDINAAGDPTGN